MKLGKLLPGTNFGKIKINNFTNNSSKINKGDAFIAIKGEKTDGHLFIKDAIERGAAVIICEQDCGFKNQIIVENSKIAYATMCANYFKNPAKKLKLIGVTGTNGKTTITYLYKQILEQAGFKTGLIGTINNHVGDKIYESKLTTPDAFELHSLFAEMVKAGCKYAVMEVSSHALDQHRAHGLNFYQAIFTNLTQDHLDYHGTMENYLNAKKQLFKMCETAIMNFDDEYCEQMREGLSAKVYSYSINKIADFMGKDCRFTPNGTSFMLVDDNNLTKITLPTLGLFSVYNALAVAGGARLLGISGEIIAQALAKVSVKGRVEIVPTGRDFTAVIDYAHSPDGLENILSALNRVKKGRLVTLFGCGGDRDKSKRSLMGATAARLSEKIIVTSDNPRSEEPKAIIDDILTGIKNPACEVEVIENRVEAIHYAIKAAKPNDVIVLCGKGHETYQILKDETIHLDEREVIKEALKTI